MELQEFVKSVLIDVNAAVDEAVEKTSREIRFSEKENVRTIEFDIAVSAEKSGKAGIKVIPFSPIGGDVSKEDKNSTVSRVVFGLTISSDTVVEEEAIKAAKKAIKPHKPITKTFFQNDNRY